MFIACMSHCYEGGGFYFCPGADAADGMLDLCTVSGVPKWKVLLVLPPAFQGSTIATMAWSVTAARPYISAPPLLYGSIPTAR